MAWDRHATAAERLRAKMMNRLSPMKVCQFGPDAFYLRRRHIICMPYFLSHLPITSVTNASEKMIFINFNFFHGYIYSGGRTWCFPEIMNSVFFFGIENFSIFGNI